MAARLSERRRSSWAPRRTAACRILISVTAAEVAKWEPATVSAVEAQIAPVRVCIFFHTRGMDSAAPLSQREEAASGQ